MSNYKKLRITGELVIVTGLHIGTSEGFAAIGATDSPVIKHPINRLPIIPASSLKGKMRSLLAKSYNEQIAKNPTQDNIKILRLFGSSQVEKGQKPIMLDYYLEIYKLLIMKNSKLMGLVV